MSAVEKKFFVHEKAICESEDIGDNTRVWGFSHVMKGAKIGSDCNIGEHVFIENEVTIGNGCTIKNGVAVWNKVILEEGVFIGPYAVFTNDLRPRAFLKRGDTSFLGTQVKQGATIGANATIVCGTIIGEFAMVGAGSVVCKNIEPHTLVVGNPAQPIGKICYCGHLLTENNWCSACERSLSENSKDRLMSLNT